jgi:gliding motility-associated-like protein
MQSKTNQIYPAFLRQLVIVTNNSFLSQLKNNFLRSLFVIALTASSLLVNAQITNMRFTNAALTYTPITGGTTLVAAGTAVGAVSPVTNIGFTFKFQGVDYTQFSVNAAGLLKLGSVAVTTESVNSAITTTNTPKIYALWDAFSTGTAASGGGVVSSLTGTAPNRVLTVQWRVNSTGATTASGVNFQVALFETSNKIEFNYGASIALPSASIGLGGLDAANDYLSAWSRNASISSGVNFTTNTVIPGAGAGHKYIFTPTPALTSSPDCLTDQPSFWVKADAGVNGQTRTLLNVPAANRTVTSSATSRSAATSVLSSASSWRPSTAEGDNTTPTGAFGTITLDLGSVQSIDGLATMGAADGVAYLTDYTVAVSNDGVTYTTLGKFEGNETNKELRYSDFDAPVTCRYVRVTPGGFVLNRAIRLDAYTKTAAAAPANNTKVSIWEDQSGNTWDAQLATTVANQPTYFTNKFNFNPSIQFATGNTLDIPNYVHKTRYSVTASTLNGIPTIFENLTPATSHTGFTGVQETAETVSFQNLLTTTEQSIVESYLATKYGITKATDYMAADGTTKTFDQTANAGYTNNIFGIGRADCQGLHQRQSKSVNTTSLMTIGNNNIIDFTNGNTATSGNDIATNNSYLLLGDNGGSLSFNTSLTKDSKIFLSRIWKLQETGTIGSVKISVPGFGNTATTTLPNLVLGNSMPATPVLYLVADNDGNFTNGGTTYYPMTAVGSGATLTYEANADLTSAAPFISFAIGDLADTDGDGVTDYFDIDADNDGILNAVESPACYYTAEEMMVFDAVSSELTQYSTWVITNSIEPSSAGSAFNQLQNWVGKEIFHFTAKSYTATSSLTFNLVNWALSSSAASTFKLQGSVDGGIWTDLSTPVASTATSGTFTVTNTLAPTTKFKYFRLIGVAGTSSYGGVTYVTLNVPATYSPSANPKETCVGIDSDNDGKFNHLELDSDGDGCFDAIEAGVLTSSVDGMLPAPWGANGLADAKETVAENGIYNSLYTYDYVINKGLVLCADFDGDGILDLNDLDDDNDGVLDQVESPNCFLTREEISRPVNVSTELTMYQATTRVIGHSTDNVPATGSAFMTGQNWVGKEIFKFEAGSYTLISGVNFSLFSWAISSTSSDTFKLQGSQDNYTWFDLSAPVSSTATTGTFTVSNTLQPNTRFKYFKIIGVAGTCSYAGVSEMTLNIPAAYVSGTNPKATCIADSDNDLKLNHQDLDSDGDGCFDAVEAGVLPRTTTTGIVPGTSFGVNGFANDLETVADNGIYRRLYNYDYAVNSTIINCTDTDGDGLLNLIDIDDDNDGVLDADEAPTCYISAVQWNNTNKTPFVTITSPLNTLAPNTNFAALTDNATTAAVQFVTATAQTQFNRELIRATFTSPVQLDAIYIAKTSTTQIFSATASSLMLQGTNDPNGSWINLLAAPIASPANATNTTANGSVALVNSNKFTIATNAGRYRHYRIFGLTDSDVLAGVATEFYFDVNAATYIPSTFTNAICTTDTDTDGIINTLDLDSDGDGCSDAVEASANRAATSATVFPTGTDANANGLLDSYEGTPAGSINYFSTYTNYALVKTIDSCLDTDLDGVPDSLDLDDDNDGVVDADEQVDCAYPLKDLTALTFNGNATGVFTANTLTTAATVGSTWGTKYSDQKLKLPIHLEWTTDATNHVMFGLLPVGRTKVPANYTDNAYKVYHNSGNIYGYLPPISGWAFNRPYTAGDLIEMDINTAGVVTIRLNGWVVRSFKGAKSDYNLAFSSYNNAKVLQNIKLTAYSPIEMVCTDIDSDGDGKVNRLDLDSDNDGCNDAVEGGAATIATAIPFVGAVGTNGLINSLEETVDSGDLTYLNTYGSYAINNLFNVCADTDKDGVGDLKDIDDDNDGIIDDIESACTSPLFVNKTSVSTTSLKQLTGTILKETGDIDYELKMTGPAVAFNVNSFDGGNGLHVAVGDGGKLNIVLDLKLTASVLESSIAAAPPKIKSVDFGPNVPINTVPSTPINEAQSMTLTWPGAYGIVYDPFNQLSSHNTGDIIESGDLIEQDVNISAADVIAKKTWMVRMFMHNSKDVYNIKAEIYGDPTLGVQSYGFNLVACLSEDSDSDGKINQLDLDSDDDGCSDAFEAGATSTAATSVIPGLYGSNGFAASLENNDDIDAVPNFVSQYFVAITDSSNKCLDSDGDGVFNLIDIDDDNDGILDAIEQECGKGEFSTPDFVGTPTSMHQVLTGEISKGLANVGYEINLVGVNTVYTTVFGGTLYDSFDASEGLHYDLLDNDNVYSQVFRLTPSSPTIVNKFVFGVNTPAHSITVTNDKQDIALSWSEGVKAVVFDPDDQLSSHASGDVLINGATISTRAGYSTRGVGRATWKIEFLTNSSNSFFLQTTHKLTSTGTSFTGEGYGLSADLCYPDDTDNDKIPDYLDLDSDGDVCSDAYEASAASSATSVNQTIPGPYGANGYANSIETNDTQDATNTYKATTYMAYASTSACADTDNDGILDKDDIDDDNDGITDFLEYSCQQATVTRGRFIATGPSKNFKATFNTNSASADLTTKFANLSTFTSATDATASANYLVSDADKVYQTKTAISPVSGTFYNISYGPALGGNTNTGISIGQQSIIVNWNISATAVVNDPDDQLSSHATGDIISPGATLVTRGDYTNSSWNIVLNLPYYSREIIFDIAHSGTANLSVESFGFATMLCTKTIDFDGDGKGNAVDLDSDGDGCSDFVEAKTGQSTKLTDQTIGGTYGLNGLSSLIENNDTKEATSNFIPNSNYLDRKVKSCTDTDGDNVADLDDIDDDNDGILDATECPIIPPITDLIIERIPGNNTQFRLKSQSTNTTIGMISLQAVSNAAIDPFMIISKDLTFISTWRDSGKSLTTDRVIKFKFEPVAPYTALKVNFLANEGANGIWAAHARNLRIDGGNAGDGIITSIPKRSLLKEPYNVGDVITKNDRITSAFKTAIWGPTAQRLFIKVAYEGISTVAKPLEITYTWNTNSIPNITVENFGFQLQKASAMMGDGTCDYDKDGINDDLDSDSDNDGCPDTKEAVHGKPYAQSSPNYIKGPYGANGFSALMETNDTFAANYSNTSWLPKVTTSPKYDYVNELINTQCTLPFIKAAGPTEFCAEGSVDLSIDLNKGPIPTGYQWLKNGVAIATATNSTFTATESGEYTCTLTYATGPALTTDIQDVIENPLPAPPVISGYTGPVCLGTPLNLTSSYTVGNQWYYNNSLISGATNATYAITNSGDYKVEYTDPLTGCKSFSSTTVVVISNVPITPTVSIVQTTCSSNKGTITVNPTGVSTDLYSIDGTNYQVSNVFTDVIAGTYSVRVKNSSGCISGAASAVINVQPVSPATPTITNTGTAICAGGATVLTSSESTGNQWFVGGVLIPGATNPTFTASAAGNYTVEVTNTAGCSTMSAVTQITVSPSPTATLSQSTVLSSNNCGTSAPVLLTASTDATSATYAWYFNNNLIGGESASTYSAVQTGSYTVKVTNTATGCSTLSAATNVTTGPSASSGSPATICVGQNFTFTATVTGFTSPTFAWEYSANGTSGWATPITGVANTISYLATTAGYYRVVVSDTTPQTVTSCPTQLQVTALPIVSVTNSLESSTPAICAGQTLDLTAVGTGISTYQWYNGSTSILGATSPTFTASLGGSYSVLVTNSNGCQATSAPVTVTVNALPDAPTTTVVQPTCTTTTGTITVTAPLGTGFTYSINNGTFQSNPVFSGLAAGTYTLIAKDALGCVGNLSTQTVNAAPVALTLTGTIDGKATPFLAETISYSIPPVTGAISYQWTLPSAWSGTSSTNTILATTAAMTDNTGVVTVRAINEFGCLSEPLTLNVAIKPAKPTVVDLSYCQNATVSALTATAATGGTLNWYAAATGGTMNATAPTPSTTTAGTTSYFVSQTVSGVESDRAELVVTINPAPAALGAISGENIVLASSSQTYSVSPVSGASTYVWTLPSGYTGSSTTNTINVTVGTSPGTISVLAKSALNCENIPQTLAILIKPTAPVTAPVSYCQNVTASPLTATATGTLNWYDSLTSTTKLIAAPTPDTQVAAVTRYYVTQTVNGVESDRAELAVTVKLVPSKPGPITGEAIPTTGDTEEYSIAPVANATSYTWTLPNGWIGSSTTNTISVVVGSAKGTISVVANANACSSASTTLDVELFILPDTDGDGVTDAQEAIDGTDPNDPCKFILASQTLVPTDSWKSADCDGDGVTNEKEKIDGTNPTDPCSLKVASQTLTPSTAWNNADCDGDGVTNGKEITDGTNPFDPCSFKLASQTLATSTAWNNADCDEDGLTNQEEKTGIDNPSTPANPNNKITDPSVKDTDGDGVTDGQEAIDGTDPNDPCSLKIASQTLTPSTAWNNADCDGDGVTNAKEKTDGTDPIDPCSFILSSQTTFGNEAWKLADCDGDGVSNGKEVTDGTDPNDPCSFKITSQTLTPSTAWSNADCDGDGVTNAKEITDGTDPNNLCSFKLASQTLTPSTAWKNADCDVDGLTNEEEKTGIDNPSTPANPNGKITDPSKKDTDGDGVTDAQEAIDGTDPNDPCSFKLASQTLPTSAAWLSADCDGDGLTNEEEKTGIDNPSTPVNPNGKITNPTNVDTDGDGVTDSQEAIDGTDPNDPCKFKLSSQTVAPSTAWNDADCDGDGVTNAKEKEDGTDPTDPCSFKLVSQTLTPSTAWNNADCDGDGVTNEKEKIDGTDPKDPCSFKLSSQTVEPSTTWKNADCDGDGESNSLEKEKGTDPLDKCSNSVPFPAPTITSSGSEVCAGTLIKLTSSVASGYQWFKDGIAINGATSRDLDTYESGSYTVKVLNSLGCTSVSSLAEVVVVTAPLTVNIAEGAVLAMNGSCNSTPIKLTVSVNATGVSYQWSKDGVDINGATAATYDASGPGLYKVRVSKGGCTTESAGTKILPAADASTSLSPIVCAGEKVELSVSTTGYSPSATYQWKKDGVNIALNATNPVYFAEASGVYTVAVTDGATTVSCPLTITVNVPPVVNVSAPAATICAGEESTLTATATGTAPFTYKWRVNGIEMNTETSNIFKTKVSGTFDVKVTDANGCEVISAQTVVTVNALPEAVVASATSQPTCNISTGTIEVSTPAVTTGMTYSINGIDYTNTTGLFENVASGTYTVTAKNANGCVSASATVQINAQPLTPAQPGVISGAINVLPNTEFTYTISAVTGATSYTWTLPNGWVGTSTTTSITAKVATTGGTISVVANAGACISPASTLTVTLDITTDTDGDGVVDSKEILDGTDPSDPCEYVKSSITVTSSSSWDALDCDGDGVTNGKEITDGTDPSDPCSFKLASQTLATSTAWNNADCDGDGVTNGKEKSDGTDPSDPCSFKLASQTLTPSAAWNDADCDGDGVTNAKEKIDGTDPNNICSFILISQTLTPSTSWKIADCDGDGLTNEEEKTGIDNPSTPANPNGKITDPSNKDTDGDGVTDSQEAIDGTDPNDPCKFILSNQTLAPSTAWNNADCDDDGLTNKEEKTGIDDPSTPANPNNKITDPSIKDTDGDGVTDAQEAIDGTDPNDPCSFKLASQTLAPSAAWKAADCDGDGVTNEKEKIDGTDPLDPCDFTLASKTLTPSAAWNSADCDGDGVINGKEITDGTDPSDPCKFILASQTVATSTAWNNADCDDDGLTNEEEKTGIDNPSTPANPNGKITDPSNKDTDGDGVTDAQEAIDGTDPTDSCSFKLASQTEVTSTAWNNADCDGDGLTNQEEKTGIDNPSTPANPNNKITDPSNKDTDGDGVTDGQEAIDGTDPNDPCSLKIASQTLTPSTAWNNADCDGDGVTNGKEKIDGTDPADPCSFILASQTTYGNDAWKIADCDGDGVTNGKEISDGTNPLDPCSFVFTSQTLTPSTAWNNADCDGDGVTNGKEVTDGTDPTDPCSFKLASQTVATSTAWNNADCDTDGLTNQEEKTGIDNPSTPANPNGKITDPSNKDTDGDGVTDAQEAIDGTDPNDPCSLKLASQTLPTSTSWLSADCDEDGLTNEEERTGIDNPATPVNPNGKITNPLEVDTDGDGVSDSKEAIDGTDPNDPCSFKLASQTVATSTAWNNADCDGDGLTNKEEKTGIDDPSTPANPNGKITDPLIKDTDGDGVTDAQEAIDGTDPNDPCSFKLSSQTLSPSASWNTTDCDGDGESNSLEKEKGTDPLDKCSNSLPFPSPTITSSGSEVCAGTLIKLTSSLASGYQWFKDGIVINGATSRDLDTYESGSYTVKVLNSLGCTSVSSLANVVVVTSPLTVNIAEGAVLAMNGTCNSTPIKLTVSANATGVSYQWSKDGVDINGATSVTYDATEAGLYKVRVSKGGCTTESAGTKILPAANASTSISPVVCAGEKVELSVNTTGYSSSATYQWRKDGVNIPSANQPIYNAEASGVYTVAVTDGATTVSCPLTITVNVPPVVSVSAPAATICAGEESTLTATATGTAPFTYKWRVNGIEMNTETSAIFKTKLSGTFDVKVTDANGCEVISAQTVVTVNALPAAVVASAISQPTCNISTGTIKVSIPAASTGITYSINGIDYTNTTGLFENVASGTYTVTAKNANACVSASATVQINAQPLTPAQPGLISGSINVLPNTEYTYTISAVTGATSYTWTLPNGWVGTSTTTSITAKASTIGGTISVVANAGACISPASTLLVIFDVTTDTDGDGVVDSKEILDGTDPNDPCEYVKSSITVTSSSSWDALDCDGDGVTNGKEVTDGTDPNDPCSFKLASQTLAPNTAWNNADCDGDGVTNGKEKSDGTDPSDPCSFKLASQTLAPSAAWNDADCDGDGVSNAKEKIDGTDPNDICSFILLSQTLTPNMEWKIADCDRDGLTNQEEKTGIDDPLTPANPNGKITDPLNKDTDGDGVTDAQEAIDGTDPNDPCSLKPASQTLTPGAAFINADCDGDGLTNEEERTGIDNPVTTANPNGKITDPTKKDTDGDGVTDAQEAIDGTNPNDACSFKLASQTLTPSNAWKVADCDGDGLTSEEEKTGIDDPSTPANPNGKITDPLNKDTDGDGVTDAQEAIDGTDPNDPCSFKLASQTLPMSTAWNNADCDGDGLTNQEEKTGIDNPSTPSNPNGKITDPSNKDTDGDGVTDGQEAIDGTDPNDPCSLLMESQTVETSAAWKLTDCDGDGLTNQEEKTGIDDPSLPGNPGGNITGSLSVDTDGDGVTDMQEAIDGTDPNNPCAFELTSQTVATSAAWKLADCDGDGLTNEEERTGIDNPSTPANPNGKITDPSTKDTDGDGVTDAQEAIDGTNPNDACSFKIASQTLTPSTAWNNADCDGDGVTNTKEKTDKTDPNDICSFKLASQTLTPSTAWNNADCDGDGLTNEEEKTGVDNPSTPANPAGKITDPLIKDTDGDGVTDAQEAIDGTNPNDACSFKVASQTLTPSSTWNNGDCDGDGVSNGKEKSDGTSPLDACSLKVNSITLPQSDAWKNADCDGDGLKNEVDGIEDCDKDGTPNFLDPDACKIDIVMANVFTPNGDGINDEIKPVLMGIDKFVCFKVYNRWGNLIFESKDREKGWDGDFRTQGQGTETFQWLAEGYDRDGKLVKRTGMITLLR